MVDVLWRVFGRSLGSKCVLSRRRACAQSAFLFLWLHAIQWADASCPQGSGQVETLSISCSFWRFKFPPNCYCPGGGSESEGRVRSQFHDENYYQDEVCKWVLSSNSAISLYFSRFELQPMYGTTFYDSVSIYTCRTVDCVEADRVLLVQTAEATPSENWQSTTGFMQIILKTNGAGNYRGFEAVWSVYGAIPARLPWVGSGACRACLPGKYSDVVGGMPCVKCPAGKYMETLEARACTDCVQGKYSAAVGSASDTCLLCLADSQAPQASVSRDACECSPGFSGPGGEDPCTRCWYGKYKLITGPDVCTLCTSVQVADLLDPLSYAARQICSMQSQTIPLYGGVNVNVRFDLFRVYPSSVRTLLRSSANWNRGDQVRMQHGPGRNINLPVLHYLGNTTATVGVELLKWSPVNTEPMHNDASVYTITVKSSSVLLKLDQSYGTD